MLEELILHIPRKELKVIQIFLAISTKIRTLLTVRSMNTVR